VVVLPNTDITLALVVAEDIRSRVKAMAIAHQSSQVSKFVSLSLGVACTIPGSKNQGSSITSPEKLIAQADLALYQAKKQGRDRVLSFRS
jgi:diguanylate cyclase (GGDEF)-like protein